LPAGHAKNVSERVTAHRKLRRRGVCGTSAASAMREFEVVELEEDTRYVDALKRARDIVKTAFEISGWKR